MSSSRLHQILGTLAVATAIVAAPASAQGFQASQAELSARHNAADASDSLDEVATRTVYSFKSRADSVAWARHRAIANKASGLRLVVSLQ